MATLKSNLKSQVSLSSLKGLWLVDITRVGLGPGTERLSIVSTPPRFYQCVLSAQAPSKAAQRAPASCLLGLLESVLSLWMFLGLPLPNSVHSRDERVASLGIIGPCVLDPSFTEPQPELLPTAWFCPGTGFEEWAGCNRAGRNASPWGRGQSQGHGCLLQAFISQPYHSSLSRGLRLKMRN